MEMQTLNQPTTGKKKAGALISEQSRVPIFQGHLSIGDLGAWKTFNFYPYYFLLRKQILYYYENENDLTTPTGWILLIDAQIEEADYIPGIKPFSFVVSHPKRKPFLLNCDEKEIFDTWLQVIRTAQGKAPTETAEEKEARRNNVLTLLNKKDNKKAGILTGVTLIQTLGEVDFQGWAQTPRPGSIEWGLRYFILKNNLLFILITDKDAEADMVLDLEDYTIENTPIQGKQFVIDVFHPACLSVTLCALDAKTHESWTASLKTSIEKSTQTASEELNAAPRATRMIRAKGGVVELRGPRKPVFMGDLSLRLGPKALDKKFFTIRRNVLFYFKNKHAAAFDPIGVVPLEGTWVERISDTEIGIKHKTRREVRLVADSKENLDDWIQPLEEASTINISEEGKKKPFFDIEERKKEGVAPKKDPKKDPSFLSTLGDQVKKHSFLLFRRRDNGNWQRAYLILKDNVLYFNWKDQNDAWPFNAVELEDYEIKVTQEKPVATFQINHPHSPSFTLSAETVDLMNSWVDELKKTVDVIRDFSDNLKADAMLAEASAKGRTGRKGTRVKVETQTEQKSEEKKEEQKSEEKKEEQQEKSD